MLYTSLDAVKNYLWITISEHDSELNLLIQKATDLIDWYLWKNLELQIFEEIVDGLDSKKVIVSNVINSVEFVKNRQTNQTYDIDRFKWYIIVCKQTIPAWEGNILVKYTSWFTTPPREIEEIALDLITILANKQWIVWTNTDKLIDKNIKTQKLGNLMITYFWKDEKENSSFDALHPAKNIERILNKYKVFKWVI